MWPRRRLATEVLGRRPLCRALERLSVWQGTLILCYHRIGDSRSSPFHPGLFSATASSFAQLELMARHFEVVSAHDLDRDPARPGRRILITFDDGYRDNYEHAFPCLRRHGLPATFFVSTGFLDSPRVAWWDELAWMVHNSRRPSMDADGSLQGLLSTDHPADRPNARHQPHRGDPIHATDHADRWIRVQAGFRRYPIHADDRSP